jgi:hypothetical protein
MPGVDLLSISKGSVTAPAGCGKTHAISVALKKHTEQKRILVLTHTNAGVAALRQRLNNAGVLSSSYRLSTIDGWAMRLIAMFPRRSGHESTILDLADPRRDYPAIRTSAQALLTAKNLDDVIHATYARVIVDEYQDCSLPQHAIVSHIAGLVPSCVLGDPLQAIFGFAGNQLVDWQNDVAAIFPHAATLDTPWRWKNANSEPLGRWLLEVRQKLLDGKPIDLREAPAAVSWVRLDRANDHELRLKAARIKPPADDDRVLIIADSKNPDGQRRFASQTPGAVAIENVDLRDLVDFARNLNLSAPTALESLLEFAERVMTNVGAGDLLTRIDSLSRGTARREASAAETAAREFKSRPSHANAVNVLVEINKQTGVRAHRPAVLRNCIKAMQACHADPLLDLHNAAIRMREQNRVVGRPLAKRVVGSTLLLKGLEGEVSVILNPAELDARNLYVAMTRGSKALVICSETPILNS